MLRINPNSNITIGDGSAMYCHLNADEVSDLSEAIGGVNIAPGSLCLVIATGDFYALNADGEWINVTSSD